MYKRTRSSHSFLKCFNILRSKSHSLQRSPSSARNCADLLWSLQDSQFPVVQSDKAAENLHLLTEKCFLCEKNVVGRIHGIKQNKTISVWRNMQKKLSNVLRWFNKMFYFGSFNYRKKLYLIIITHDYKWKWMLLLKVWVMLASW